MRHQLLVVDRAAVKTCAHLATVAIPGTTDARCMDCGATILNTGEVQPGFFPAADRRAALELAAKQPAKKAARLLNLELF